VICLARRRCVVIHVVLKHEPSQQRPTACLTRKVGTPPDWKMMPPGHITHAPLSPAPTGRTFAPDRWSVENRVDSCWPHRSVLSASERGICGVLFLGTGNPKRWRRCRLVQVRTCFRSKATARITHFPGGQRWWQQELPGPGGNRYRPTDSNAVDRGLPPPRPG